VAALLELGVHVAQGGELANEAAGRPHFAPRIEIAPAE